MGYPAGSISIRHSLGGGDGGQCLRNLRHTFLCLSLGESAYFKKPSVADSRFFTMLKDSIKQVGNCVLHAYSEDKFISLFGMCFLSHLPSIILFKAGEAAIYRHLTAMLRCQVSGSMQSALCHVCHDYRGHFLL
jgi:hypothetical protein